MTALEKNLSVLGKYRVAVKAFINREEVSGHVQDPERHFGTATISFTH